MWIKVRTMGQFVSTLTDPLWQSMGHRHPGSRGFLASSHQWLEKLSGVTVLELSSSEPGLWVPGFPLLCGLPQCLTCHTRYTVDMGSVLFSWLRRNLGVCINYLQIRGIVVFVLNLTCYRSDSSSTLAFFLSQYIFKANFLCAWFFELFSLSC